MIKIGICIVATNSYFVLGVRFIKKFLHHYKGSAKVTFYFFSDTDPKPYLPEIANVSFRKTVHSDWVSATNSKFSSILELRDCDSDYLYYFDADTNVNSEFTEEWFIGEMVGGQHYADQSWMKNEKGFDRNPASKAYVPFDTKLQQTYYYGAFFGGTKEKVIKFCETLRKYQEEDRKIDYEPGVNDESYINREFHFNPPDRVVKTVDFKFAISDKGGIGETRQTELDVSSIKQKLLENANRTIDIQNGSVVLL